MEYGDISEVTGNKLLLQSDLWCQPSTSINQGLKVFCISDFKYHANYLNHSGGSGLNLNSDAKYGGYKYNGGKAIQSHRCGRAVCILCSLMDSEGPLQEHWGTLQQHQSSSNVLVPRGSCLSTRTLGTMSVAKEPVFEAGPQLSNQNRNKSILNWEPYNFAHVRLKN